MTIKEYLESQLKIEEAKLKSYNITYASYSDISFVISQATIGAIKEIKQQLKELK